MIAVRRTLLLRGFGHLAHSRRRLCAIVCSFHVCANPLFKKLNFSAHSQADCIKWILTRQISSGKVDINEIQFEKLSEETLQSLAEYLDLLSDHPQCPDDYDVAYSQGVLTLRLGSEHGTYVINKQAPNRQIWLSSPVSGPKRYDFLNGTWVYMTDRVKLHDLLNNELRTVFRDSLLDFTKCVHGSS